MAVGRESPARGEWTAAELAAIGVVAGLALLLRFHDLGKAPLFTDNADELAFAWAGLNLILQHDPISWSYFPAYHGASTLQAFGTTYPIVHHWLDHPPLFALLVGGWAWLMGDRSMLDVTADQMRFLPALFSTLTVVFVYWLGRDLLGRLPALMGALLLATAPAAVLMGRLAEPDGLLGLLLLVALVCCAELLRGAGGRWAAPVLLGCALLAPLVKVPGITVGGIAGVVLLVSGRWKLGAALLGAAVAGLLLYVLWGALIDWNIFLAVWKDQATRRDSVLSAYQLIVAPTGANRDLRDPWWILGWIGVGAWLVTRRGRRELLLAWPVAAFGAAIMVLAGESQLTHFGWYRLPILPLVYLAAGYLVWLAVAAPSLGRLTLLLFLGGAAATNWWLGANGKQWNPDPFLLTGILAAILLPAGLAAWRSRERGFLEAARWAALAAVAVMVLGNILESLDLSSLLFRL